MNITGHCILTQFKPLVQKTKNLPVFFLPGRCCCNCAGSVNAIGYSYLYYVDSLYKSGSLKVLSVDGIPPTAENLRGGAYPYTVYYYAVYAEGNETAARFAEFI